MRKLLEPPDSPQIGDSEKYLNILCTYFLEDTKVYYVNVKLKRNIFCKSVLVEINNTR